MYDGGRRPVPLVAVGTVDPSAPRAIVARKILSRLRSPASVTAAPREAEPPVAESLSERELAVLRLLGRGAGNREIAEALALTEGTVKNYISAILAKTGLHDRTQAALYAVRHNLTDRDIRD